MVKRCNCSAMHTGPCHADILSAKLVVNLDRAGEKRTAETADGNSDRDRTGLASPTPATDPPTQRLIDLPDHLRAYHGWLEEDVLFFEGKWRPTHDLEHNSYLYRHSREDWSA